MSKIKGLSDGVGGRNDHYDVGPRKNVPRDVIVREVERGKHADSHIYERGGEKYIRDNPDSSTKDNVNRR